MLVLTPLPVADSEFWTREELEKMGAWLRQQMGIPVDDEVPEVLELEVAANDSSAQSKAQQDVAQQQAGGDGTEEKSARTSLR